jgi:beta-glucosidase
VQAAKDEPKHTAVTPVPREGNWVKRHESFNERVKKGNVDLIFIGDSITQGWEGAGKEAWEKHFAKRNAVNLGIGGDRTQHVLWRLDNGNIEGIKPKLAVIMIGTNNSNRDDNTAEEIADGIKAIVAKLRAKLPETKILLLAIFPRGPMPNPQREKISKTNELASQVADGKMVHYLDIGPKFLTADGVLEKEVMPDFLHLSPKGYEIWAEAIEPSVEKLMSEK